MVFTYNSFGVNPLWHSASIFGASVALNVIGTGSRERRARLVYVCGIRSGSVDSSAAD